MLPPMMGSRAICSLLVLLCLCLVCLCLAPARAEQVMRVATYNTDLHRKGPGLLLRDIRAGEDQVLAIAQVIAHARPDVIVLQGVDYDLDLLALRALAVRVGEAGWDMPHAFALRPNSGMATGVDLDGDGRLGGPRDAQGFGFFSGQGGMAILSRHPVDQTGVRDFSSLLWRDLPGANPPLSDEALSVQRLSSVGHWVVPLRVGNQTVQVLAFHATTPAFDGPEDRNGWRNHDEIAFWRHYLDGAFQAPPAGAFVLAGNANLDPVDGDGRHEAIRMLLDDARLRDPRPARSGAASQGQGHGGDPRLDTAAWDAPDPGHLRVSYVLPSANLTVLDSGVFWPAPDDEMAQWVDRASRHRLVWVDLALNGPESTGILDPPRASR